MKWYGSETDSGQRHSTSRRTCGSSGARAPVGVQAPTGAALILPTCGTASAAEVLAAALQQNARAIVVGEATFGKGWAWTMTTSPAGIAVARCAARWLTPNGISIEGRGLQPDLAVGGGEDDAGEDAASIAAIALADELLAGP